MKNKLTKRDLIAREKFENKREFNEERKLVKQSLEDKLEELNKTENQNEKDIN